MKKWIFVIVVLVLSIGCEKGAILHTYYGDFCTDTLEVFSDDTDGSLCYLVHTEASDTFKAEHGTIVIHGPVKVYYNPEKNIYYKKYPVSGRGSKVLMYNPVDNTYGY